MDFICVYLRKFPIDLVKTRALKINRLRTQKQINPELRQIKVSDSWHYLEPMKPRLKNQTGWVDHITAAKLKLFKDSNQPQQRVDPYA